DGHTSANQPSGNASANKIANIRRHKRHPGKHRNLFQTEPSRIAQILRQPEDEKPPNRIGKRPADHYSPRLSLSHQTPESGDLLGGSLPLDARLRARPFRIDQQP